MYSILSSEGSELDTIFALASGPPPSAVAIVRVSGPKSIAVAESLSGRKLSPRRIEYANLRNPLDGESIDHGLIVVFSKPKSFTGEDVAEFQIHGSRSVVAALTQVLSNQRCRPAKAGEFSKRAFMNGKMDIIGVEALGDLILAETENQRKQALFNMTGGFRVRFERWRQEIISCLSIVETNIDFSDEYDIPDVYRDNLNKRIEIIERDMDECLKNGNIGNRIMDGYSVVIAGPPNVGKSSLMNALADRDVSIVSTLAGTTRDVIEIGINLKGYPISLIDTAGLRHSEEFLEMEGITRAKNRIDSADVVVWVTEWGHYVLPPPDVSNKKILEVVSKIDLADFNEVNSGEADRVFVSALKNIGLREFEIKLADFLFSSETVFEPSVVTRARQVAKIQAAAFHMRRALKSNLATELVCEDLRSAARELDELVGVIECEEVLDDLFNSFCIGK